MMKPFFCVGRLKIYRPMLSIDKLEPQAIKAALLRRASSTVKKLGTWLHARKPPRCPQNVRQRARNELGLVVHHHRHHFWMLT